MFLACYPWHAQMLLPKKRSTLQILAPPLFRDLTTSSLHFSVALWNWKVVCDYENLVTYGSLYGHILFMSGWRESLVFPKPTESQISQIFLNKSSSLRKLSIVSCSFHDCFMLHVHFIDASSRKDTNSPPVLFLSWTVKTFGESESWVIYIRIRAGEIGNTNWLITGFSSIIIWCRYVYS